MDNVIRIRKMCLASMFLTLGWLLPLVTGQIHAIGNMLCPMHLPVMLCGFVLGPMYGVLIGFITPLTRTLIFGMPVLYPFSICMALELATYGFLCGLLYKVFSEKFSCLVSVYLSLVIAIVFGRLVWGISRLLCGIVSNNSFTMTMFISGGFITAWPGIILQLIIIPLLIKILRKANILEKFK